MPSTRNTIAINVGPTLRCTCSSEGELLDKFEFLNPIPIESCNSGTRLTLLMPIKDSSRQGSNAAPITQLNRDLSLPSAL